MLPSLALLTTFALCDALSALLQADRGPLVKRQSDLQYQLGQFAITSPEVEAALAAVVAQRANIGTYISSLPAGTTARAQEELKKERLDVQFATLTNRQMTWGVAPRLQHESDLDRVTKDIATLDGHIADVATHRATLSA